MRMGFRQQRRIMLEAELQRMAAELPALGVDRAYLTGSFASGQVEPDTPLELVIVQRTEEPFRRRADFFSSHLGPRLDTRFHVYTPAEFDTLSENEDDLVLRRTLSLGEMVHG